MEAPYTFRPHTKDDLNFIQNSWGKSYAEGVNGNRLITSKEFHSYHRPIREKILNRPNIAIIVCCSKDSEDLIIGYSIVEKPRESRGLILHYLYVKSAFKQEGIAKQLIKKSCVDRPILYTHSTTLAGKIIHRYKARQRQDLERFLFTPHLI